MRPDYGMGSVSADAEIAVRDPKSAGPARLKHPSRYFNANTRRTTRASSISESGRYRQPRIMPKQINEHWPTSQD